MSVNWIEVTLDDVCSKITDGAHHSPKSVDDGLPMASVKDMTPFGLNLGSARQIGVEDYHKLVKQGCQPIEDDVLIAKDGNSALDTVCRVKKTEDVVLLSSVAILCPDKDVIYPDFLRLYLDAEPTRNYLKASSISGAAIPRVILKDFKRAKISLPKSIDEQKSIADKVANYDNLIENNNRRIAILEDMAQSLYREWFVKFRFPGYQDCEFKESELGLIPEGWEVKPIAEEIGILGGGTPKKSEAEYWDESVADINWFTPTNLTKHSSMFIEESGLKITELGLKKSSAKMFPAYSVMMTSRATIGVISINTKPACTNQGFIICVPNERVNALYIYYWLIANMQTINNIASGATFKEVRRTLFKELPFLIPSDGMMDIYKKTIVPITSEIENLIKKNRNLKAQRDMLLPKLISGHIAL